MGTHGGARANSGPKKGTSIKRSEETMAKAEALGVDPVEMLLEVTKWAYEQFTAARSKEHADMLKDYAKECAPYVRPKLSSIDARIDGEMTVEIVRFGANPPTG